jgi:hypothetical protein
MPKRISMDKLRRLQEAKDGRSYNIITNALSNIPSPSKPAKA